MASPSPRLGVHNPTPKLQSLLSQERRKLRTANLAYTFTGSIQTQAHEKFGRIGSVSEPRDSPNFWRPPIISGMGKATNVKFGRYIQRVHANKSRLKIWEKMERGCIEGLPKFFWSLLSQERIKLRTSNLAGICMGPCEQNSFTILGENRAWAYIQGLPKFFEYPLLSQERVKLRTSNFVRYALC